jgi:hypothetical protein
MIAVHEDRRYHGGWQQDFVELLPQIEERLKLTFRHLDPDGREEAIQSATVFCLLSFMRLHRRGRAGAVSASNLVWYGVLQVKCGRPAVGRMNSKEVLSLYAQLRRGIKVEPIHTHAPTEPSWIALLVEDKRAPVPDQVAARLDFAAWIHTLSRRFQRIAADLACGFTTSEMAQKYGLSPGRISQIRRELEASWMRFQSKPSSRSATV